MSAATSPIGGTVEHVPEARSSWSTWILCGEGSFHCLDFGSHDGFSSFFSGDVAFERVFGCNSAGNPTVADVDISISAVDRKCSAGNRKVSAAYRHRIDGDALIYGGFLSIDGGDRPFYDGD
jgi:hypothetical protein